MAIKHKGILLGSLSIAILLGMAVVFVTVKNRQEPTAAPLGTLATVSSGTRYTNTLIGYSLIIPSGYRLASDYMRFISSLKDIGGYSPLAYDVVLTTATEADEQSSVEKLKETYDGLDKHSEEYLIFPAAPHYLDDPHLSTSILISPTGASYSEVTRNVPSNPHIAAYQEVAFSGQQKELRLTYKRPEGELNQVIIPYNGKAKLPSGNPIGIMTIGMLQERDAQQQAFNAVVNSFLYR